MRSWRCGPLTWLAVLYSFLFRCGYGRLQRRPESCARGGLGLTRARMLQYHIQSATMCHLNSELVTRWWPGNPTGWKLGRFFCLEREWWVCWPHFNKWTRGLNEMRWPNEMGKGRDRYDDGSKWVVLEFVLDIKGNEVDWEVYYKQDTLLHKNLVL